ncbi:hypothetical protein M758_11G068400 [Ceratodon purpureus]|nr:hypothetical protein M758_11G068400 [Ceratodon purpureus]
MWKVLFCSMGWACELVCRLLVESSRVLCLCV